MSVEAIGAIFVGLAAVLTALGNVLLSRARRQYEDVRQMRRDMRILQRRFRVAVKHIFDLEVLLSSQGIDTPERPSSIDEFDEDEDETVKKK
jgi:hypothetical protein